MITELSDEQTSLISVYRDKWKRIAFSTEKIDRQEVTDIVKTAYRLGEQNEPKIFFFDSPLDAFQQVGLSSSTSSTKPLLLFDLGEGITKQIKQQFAPPLWTWFWRRTGYLYTLEIVNGVYYPLIESLEERSGSLLSEQTKRQLQSLFQNVSDIAMLDFCISVLGCSHDSSEKWQTLLAVVENCFWHIAFAEMFIVCERPIEFSVNFESFWQKSEDSALDIRFADGFYLSDRNGSQ
jgi:hypothetical protein